MFICVFTSAINVLDAKMQKQDRTPEQQGALSHSQPLLTTKNNNQVNVSSMINEL